MIDRLNKLLELLGWRKPQNRLTEAEKHAARLDTYSRHPAGKRLPLRPAGV